MSKKNIKQSVLNSWRVFYDKSHDLNFKLQSAKYEIGLRQSSMHDIQEHLDMVLWECKRFLDKNGLYKSSPKWKYDPKDDTTWASSPNFAYKHML